MLPPDSSYFCAESV